MKPEVLLTGVTGHVGRSVAKLFAGQGVPVLGIGRDPARLRAVQEDVGSPNLQTTACDISRPEEVVALAQKYGSLRHLIHSAALVTAGSLKYQDYYLHNVDATVLLLAHLKPVLRSVVYLSSFDVYSVPLPCPVRETSPTVPATYYGASKLAGELYLHLFERDTGVKSAALRCSSIYGPGETIARAMKSFLRRAVENKPLVIYGDGSDLRDYIYVEDVARAVWQCFCQQASGVYNLGEGSPVSIRQLAELAVKVCGSRSPIEYQSRKKERYDLYLDTSRIQEALGFMPAVSLEQGMKLEFQSLAPVGATR
jgi:UDP-glucose 4-epimerase